MEVPAKHFDAYSVVFTLLATALFNTVIAFILTVVGYGGSFTVNLVFAQCMGLSIGASMMTTMHFIKAAPTVWQWPLLGGALLGGATFGLLIGSLATKKALAVTSGVYRPTVGVLVIAILFGIAVSYFFLSREIIVRSQARLQTERIQRLTTEKKMAETRLKLLQAQIEPHFLYNTLANILSLMESDADQARAMLMDLSRYLRATLVRTRETTATIGEEMAVVQAYVSIIKRRMGDRLTCRLAVPEDLMSRPFPPMLVQPLVENAIQHGIEPLVEGGLVSVQATRCGDKLRVQVTDTGRGMTAAGSAAAGVGIANVSERLQAIYGEKARLIIEENRPSGVKATIEAPLEPH